MLKQIIPALRITLALTVLTGLLYPGAVTGLSQLLFHRQANGSLMVKDGHVVGSGLIGQNFVNRSTSIRGPRPPGTADMTPRRPAGRTWARRVRN